MIYTKILIKSCFFYLVLALEINFNKKFYLYFLNYL